MFALVLVALATAPLAGCTAESGTGDQALADLRADLQRVQKESDKQKELISALQRRVDDWPKTSRACAARRSTPSPSHPRPAALRPPEPTAPPRRPQKASQARA